MILIEEQGDEKDYYFLKLSGDQDIVGQQATALRTAIGADIKSETKFELKDAQ